MPNTEFVPTQNYIRELKEKMDELEERNREHKTKLTNAQGKKYNKRELCPQYHWDDKDCYFSDTICFLALSLWGKDGQKKIGIINTACQVWSNKR